MEKAIKTQIAIVEELTSAKRNYDKTSVARRTRSYINKRIEMIDTSWENFRENDCKIRTIDDFDSKKYDPIYDSADELYFNFYGELTQVLEEFDAITPPPQNAPQPVIPIVQPQPSPYKLPQITLPTFCGDYSTWSAFHAMFVSLIHSNGSLSNLQKLHFLKSNLRGQAANLLNNTPITDANYAVAWAALQERYSNKKKLVDTQLKILINQPVQSSESASNIRLILDTTLESLNALRVLNIDVATWDPLLLFILTQKLSKETQQAWETSQLGIEELPSLNNFTQFLKNRFRMLESLADRSTPSSTIIPKTIRPVKSHATVSAPVSKPCPVCSGNHYLRDCSQFLAMSIPDRQEAVKSRHVCFNCLVPGHFITECRNRMKCQKCSKRHHTLLHDTSSSLSPSSPPFIAQASTSQVTSSSGNVAAIHTTLPAIHPAKVLLATAIVNVVASNGKTFPLRALIDQGSQVTFMTENAAQLLKLKTTSIDLPITGIGSTAAGNIRRIVQVQIRSAQCNKFSINANALIIKNITGLLPPVRCQLGNWPHLNNLQLADPQFSIPSAIDILLGADVYANIIQVGLLRGPEGAPLAQSTVFGWILSGSTNPISKSVNNVRAKLSTLHTCIDIDSRLKSFWEIEECNVSEPPITEEEAACEQHYVKTHTRSSDGRYIVRLPLQSVPILGDSRKIALQRLLQMERRLNNNPNLKSAYIDFMREYISLGHMQVSPPSTDLHRYYIPHHAVLNENSSTTKVRVVFDASCKSSNNVSLNELMLIGPKIQDDLATILLRWRKFPFAFTADVEKMYRQILVNESDQHLQHILWRESPNDPIKEYALQTVTYGMSCAPHLAVRTLFQLAMDNQSKFPIASQIALRDFYVDDLMSGTYTAADALSTRRQLSDMLASGKFKLRKWVSNHSPLLDEIALDDRKIQQPLNIKINNTVTALGIIWNPATDEFSFKLDLPINSPTPSKRTILSEITKLFDPLGWLAPIIVRSKILMQQLWVKGVGWDENLPESIIKSWTNQRGELFNINCISIPRWIRHTSSQQAIELHGFGDASTNAYAAVIYARIQQADGSYITTILIAKTRVAPLKQISIPRLELCGALLTAELLKRTQQNLQIPDVDVFAWTDSSIVLHWLKAQPRQWKTFVANRVSSIQKLIPISSQWRHVPTADNPADCASRGIDIHALHQFKLWWEGPSWLKEKPSKWPEQISKRPIEAPNQEQRATITLTTTKQQPNVQPDEQIKLLESFSSLGRLLRVTAYCKRFISKCKKSTHRSTALAPEDIQEALRFWIHTTQQVAFESTIQQLIKSKPLSPKSTLLSLNPFLDEYRIIRVGGRLQNTSMTFNEKHPIILDHKSHLSTLIIRMHHLHTMHGGTELVLGLIRKQY